MSADAKRIVSLGETALPLLLGFHFVWPETKRRSRLRLVAALRTSKRLKVMPQKLRKGALKLLKDPRNYRILIGPQSRPIRALKGPSALVFNGLTG
jgi:hypothetical protein